MGSLLSRIFFTPDTLIGKDSQDVEQGCHQVGQKDKKVVNICELLKIEKEIDVVVELVDDDLFSTIRKEKMISLEVQKEKILKQDEESCRIKS